MNTRQLPTLKQLESANMKGLGLELQCTDSEQLYGFVQTTLVHYQYHTKLGKKEKGLVRKLLTFTTNCSAATLTRLIKQHKDTGKIVMAVRTQPAFTSKFNALDIAELARIDELFEDLSGPSICQVLRREYEIFGNLACERLSTISVSHLYNLRNSDGYRCKRVVYTKTKNTPVSIGERSKPITNGCPGCVRVDSVHQGDKDGKKGVYHVNLVDEVTQWEVVICVEGISQEYMVPALVAAMQLFPFEIYNFHADNGSEYINKQVAQLLNGLNIKLTKSRPRHSGDNGLVETKNGAVIRKALGYAHIPRTTENVETINQWYMAWFVPYLNFHRPCAYRKTEVNTKTGRITHTYPTAGYMTPYDKLKKLKNSKQYLKEGVSFEKLDHQAYAMSDTVWAERTQEAKAEMWKSIQF